MPLREHREHREHGEHHRGRLTKKAARSGTGAGEMIRQQNALLDTEASSSLAPDVQSSGVTAQRVQDMIREAMNQQRNRSSGSPGKDSPSGSPSQRGTQSESGNQNLTPRKVRQMIQQALQQQEGSSTGGGASGGGPSVSGGGSLGQKHGQGGQQQLTVQQVQEMIQQALNQPKSGSTSPRKPGSSESGARSASGDLSSNSSSISRLKKLVKKGHAQQPSNSGRSSSSHQSDSDGSPSSQSTTGGSSPETVAQVLTQDQYQLSQELEANLMKLKSVIRESQEIAKKIELVLGQGNRSSGGKNS
ncbi:MAG: hypothetical protein M0Z36_01800 [Thermaerobacter sp.]|nr:hypothetical protein [Thermaerobacter sp.]